jgi:hypothetical protein
MHKRPSAVLSRARWLLPAAAFALFGCPNQDLAPIGPCTVSAVTERVDQTGVDQVDLLFVIDNSGSMASEQQRLGQLLPNLVRVLTTGDKTPPEDGSEPTMEERNANPDRFFTPVRSLHIGVVTSNMGGIDEPPTSGAISSCRGAGDDGRLQNSTEIAQAGVTAMTNIEFEGYRSGEVVIPPDDECDIPKPLLYQTFVANDEELNDVDEVANTFRCVSRVGIRGCPFEQQLEAMWKALAPEEAPEDAEDEDLYKFLDGKGGQGTRTNEGFLRDEAILAIMHVSDEEDCSLSATKNGAKLLFDPTRNSPAEEMYGEKINLRCGLFGEKDGLVWPAERYVKGLRSLKPDYPDRIIFGAIVGIPTELKRDITIKEILERGDMQFAEDGNTGLPRPSCVRDNPMMPGRSDKASPPRRFLQVADAFGPNAVIHSICDDTYAPALDRLIERIAQQLKGNCLPRMLRPNAAGLVECEVFELLSSSDTKCDPGRGHVGEVVERTLRENNKNVKRRACRMAQVPVVNGERDTSKDGWYYDQISKDLEQCPPGEKQRIAFSFGELPSGAGATFECFQSVASVDLRAKGVAAVNTSCTTPGDDTPDLCPQRSDDDYDMICLTSTNTCQITCANDPQCPPGWVCAQEVGASGGPKFCQQPTCQGGSGGGSTEDE